MKQLEECGLIDKKVQGLNKPALIYVKNFAYYRTDGELSTGSGELSHGGLENKLQEVYDSASGSLKNKPPEVYETNRNHTNPKNLDRREINQKKIYRPQAVDNSEIPVDNFVYFPHICLRCDTRDSNAIRMAVEESIELYSLTLSNLHWKKELEQMYSIIVAILSSRKKSFRISKSDIHANIVKETFAKITREHIEYVIECFSKTNTKINSFKAYMQTSLYNSVLTMDTDRNQGFQDYLYEDLRTKPE